MPRTTTPPHFANLDAASTALLTTFRRTGEGVSAPVSITVDGDDVYFVTAVDSGKAKRLARNGAVTIAPCTTRGTVVGDTVAGRALPLGVADRPLRRRVLRPTRPIFWSYLLYRLRGRAMRVYRVVPDRA